MSRPLRIEYENALYHVMARGIRKEPIFFQDIDRIYFLEKIADMVIKYKSIIHSYVLMPNHYHILIETPQANLSKMMHFLNCSYANWFNQEYKIVGPLLQGRFKAKLIEQEEYFCNASAYIHLNPLRASLVKSAEEYRWSSYSCFVGERPSPPWLSHEILLSEFAGDSNDYRCFVIENYLAKKDLMYESLYENRSMIMGSDAFKKKIQEMAQKKISEESKREIPQYHILVRISINELKTILLDVLEIPEEVLYKSTRNNMYKKIALHVFNRYADATQETIARLFSMHNSAVSHAAREIAEMAKKDVGLADLLNRINKSIMSRKCQALNLQ